MDHRPESDISRALQDAFARSRAAPPHRKALLRADVRPGSSTGRTHHARGGEGLAEPRSLLISQVDGDPGYYLSYLDDCGEAQTNTYHDSLEQAFRQAEFEFTIGRSDWQAIREE